MHFFNVTDEYINKNIIDVLDFWLETSVSEREMLVAIGFVFVDKTLIFCSDADSDTILVYSVTDIKDWIKNNPYGLNIVCKDNLLKEMIVEKKIFYIWKCENTMGFVDAVDLAVGDLIHPNVKILCEASELFLFSISEIEYPNNI